MKKYVWLKKTEVIVHSAPLGGKFLFPGAGAPGNRNLQDSVNTATSMLTTLCFIALLYHEWHQKLFDRCKTALMWLNDADRRKWFVMTR